MNDFESDLARIPLRPAPAEWRADILRAARSVTPAPAAVPWWRRWLAPQPLALAAAWLLIVALRLATPDETAAPRPADVALLKAHVRAQQQLIADLLTPPEPSSPPPVQPRGAALQRVRNQRA